MVIWLYRRRHNLWLYRLLLRVDILLCFELVWKSFVSSFLDVIQNCKIDVYEYLDDRGCIHVVVFAARLMRERYKDLSNRAGRHVCSSLLLWVVSLGYHHFFLLSAANGKAIHGNRPHNKSYEHNKLPLLKSKILYLLLVKQWRGWRCPIRHTLYKRELFRQYI